MKFAGNSKNKVILEQAGLNEDPINIILPSLFNYRLILQTDEKIAKKEDDWNIIKRNDIYKYSMWTTNTSYMLHVNCTHFL